MSRGVRPPVAALLTAGGVAAAIPGAVANELAAGARTAAMGFGALVLVVAFSRAPSVAGVVRRGTGRRGRAAAAALAVAGAGLAVAGGPAAFALAALLPAVLRTVRPGRGGRRGRALRDACGVALLLLLLRPSGASLAGAAATVLASAAALARVAAPPGIAARPPLALAPALAVALLAPLLFALAPRRVPGGAAEPAAHARHGGAGGDGRGGARGTGGGAALPERSVALGDIGRLQRDLRPLLDVRFRRDGAAIDGGAFGPLLRAGSLEAFDGVRWWAPHRPAVLVRDGADDVADGWVRVPRREALPPGAVLIDQEVRFLAGGTDSLFCVGLPVAFGGDAAGAGVLVAGPDAVRAARDVAEGGVLLARSAAVPGVHGVFFDAALPEERRVPLLAVPRGHDSAAALGRAVVGTASGVDALRRVGDALAARCTYSLEIADAGAMPPVEHFLFVARRGHCELFASAAAVMLRGAGIPARVAFGFRGGEWDAAGARRRFRGADAHAWVEAHLPGRGWTTFDPTPDDGPDVGAMAEAGEARVAAPGAGAALRRWLEFDGPTRERVVAAAVAALGSARRALVSRDGLLAVVAAGLLFLLRGVRGGGAATRAAVDAAAPPPPPAPEAWALVLARLAAAGWVRGAAETDREFAVRALAAGTAPREALRDVAAAAERERWEGVAPDATERARLMERARAVEPPAPDR